MSHPATYSAAVLECFGEILLGRWPDWFGRPLLFDPYAGTGVKLAAWAQSIDFDYSGIEIEESFIVAPHIHPGDATVFDFYPPARHPDEYRHGHWVVVTSPVYPNGMADNHLARDGSPRKNYRKAKAELTGNDEAKLHPNNMGNYGYRGSKRPEAGGTSKRREAYWTLAHQSVPHWSTAELVLVNVSDFTYTKGGVEHVEPVVDDWANLLSDYGWKNQTRHLVATPRMRNGANRDKRVAREVIIEATR